MKTMAILILMLGLTGCTAPGTYRAPPQAAVKPKPAPVVTTQDTAAGRPEPVVTAGAPSIMPPIGGTKVYRASDCTGPVIMGECKGAIMDPLRPAAVCHGTMLNGQCTGPMF